MDSRINQVESLFSEWDSSDRPGAVLAIVQNGRPVYTEAFGMSSIEHGIVIDNETRFRIASVSKQFLVTVVMLLVQEGKIALDEDIRTYDPELPDFGKVVTVRHALSMNSGMRDFLDILDWSGAGLERPVADSDIRDFLLRQRKLNYTPGEMFIYTNTGYRL
ncbi:MAG: beta-lactamase family protein, partial [Phycisphaerae bacterium]|nr:beta-lactamase family protein [Phycisphaerae bacterium]NIX02301.1 serine hydrolase [Phycisphaerae bacterium]NIX32222.1 serine hydrolase [Phycisphaerae bacterium]